MGQSRKRKKIFKCGHVGFGQECNRCREADRLKKYASYKSRKFKTFKKKENPNPPKVWTKEELLEEALRLREDGRKRNL